MSRGTGLDRKLLRALKGFESAAKALKDGIGFAGASPAGSLVPTAESFDSLDISRVLATPQGPVLYEDPVLQSAWTYAHNISADPPVGFAAAGEDLKNSQLHHWIAVGAMAWFNRKKRVWDLLEGRRPQVPVEFPLPLRIAVFGDAGYRGLAQEQVFNLIRSRHDDQPFHALIHLGDTYYGGQEREMLRHLVGPVLGLAQETKSRAFTLCGNHDLYAGPEGYESALNAFGQPGRYFAIETAAWRVACLDSALGAAGALRSDGELDSEQLSWLTNLQLDRKPLILMSHHAPRSAWEKSSKALQQQCASLPGLRAWYWGHEHRAVMYKSSLAHPYAGSCVGNGVFLEKFSEPKSQGEFEWWSGPGRRCGCYGRTRQHFWPHGYLELELSSAGITETFHIEGKKEPGRRSLAI